MDWCLCHHNCEGQFSSYSKYFVKFALSSMIHFLFSILLLNLRPVKFCRNKIFWILLLLSFSKRKTCVKNSWRQKKGVVHWKGRFSVDNEQLFKYCLYFQAIFSNYLYNKLNLFFWKPYQITWILPVMCSFQSNKASPSFSFTWLLSFPFFIFCNSNLLVLVF
jgi:hypothetical protein